MKTHEGDRIHALLKSRFGVENAITAPDIAQTLGIDEREVRRTIANEFREWIGTGLLLCLPKHGFFFATEVEQVVRRQTLLLSLKLEAAAKLAQFHGAMRSAGFGGLVSEKMPTTFAASSHPEGKEVQP